MNLSLPSETPEKAPAAALPRVLIVDTHEADIYVMGCYLQQLGCKYDIARNGVEALVHLAQQFYDAVFIDVVVPSFNGFELATLIRAHEQGAGKTRSLIIAMTASNYIDSQRKIDAQNKYLEFGMDSYLTKPCNPKVLAEKLGLNLRA